MNEDQILSTVLGGSMVLLLIVGLFAIAFVVVYIIGLSKLFKKAGKPGWAAIVPFYNMYVLVEIAGLNWWWFLIAISGSISTILEIDDLEIITRIATAVASFFIFYNLGKKFKQNPTTFGILGCFFSGIMTILLGFSDKYVYDDSVPVSPNGPIGDETNSSASVQPEKFCLGCGQKLKPGSQFCENCGKKVE